MPDSAYAFVVTCLPNTPATAPVEVPLPGIDPVVARKWTVTIPDGHSGLTGIALAFGHNAVIPGNAGNYISGNDWTFPFDLTGYPNGVTWSVLLCNLDIVPHSWQVIFEGDNLPDVGDTTPPMPLTTGALAQAQADALGGP